jgi:hypothetical protein
MSYALFIIELPTNDPRQLQVDYINLMQDVRRRTNKAAIAETLSTGVYLLNLENGLHDLAALVAAVEDRGYRSRTLFFDQAPSFVITNAGLRVGNDGQQA